MAGSNKWFKYTTDANNEFAIYGDESNMELVGNPDYATGDDLYGVPSNLKPRYALYRSVDGVVSRRIPISDPNALSTTLPVSFVAFGTVTVFFQSIVPERYKTAKAEDSGLNDGDAD